ncbi:MAG TPA: hypothetical protein VGK71_04820, partial [Nitrospirota bacterium]
MRKECFAKGAGSIYRGRKLLAVSLFAALAASSILFNGCKATGPKLPPDILATVNGSSITVEDFKAIRSMVEEDKPEDALTLLINRKLVSELALKAGLVGDPMAYSKREEFTAEALPRYLERDVASKITVTDEEINALRPADTVVFKVDVVLCDTQEKAQKALNEISRGGNFQEVGAKYAQMGSTAEREVRLDDNMF